MLFDAVKDEQVRGGRRVSYFHSYIREHTHCNCVVCVTYIQGDVGFRGSDPHKVRGVGVASRGQRVATSCITLRYGRRTRLRMKVCVVTTLLEVLPYYAQLRSNAKDGDAVTIEVTRRSTGFEPSKSVVLNEVV